MACNLDFLAPSIEGRWVGNNPSDGVLIFHKDGKFEILNSEGVVVFNDPLTSSVTWESVKETNPHQLYINIIHNKESKRIPFGIYKIENGKLILRAAIIFTRNIGGISLGISRYEMPKDFSDVVNVYVREK
jgi:hypothetical protein